MGGQLNLAHVIKIKIGLYKKVETKTNASAHLVWSKSKNCESTPKGTRRTMEERKNL